MRIDIHCEFFVTVPESTDPRFHELQLRSKSRIVSYESGMKKVTHDYNLLIILILVIVLESEMCYMIRIQRIENNEIIVSLQHLIIF